MTTQVPLVPDHVVVQVEEAVDQDLVEVETVAPLEEVEAVEEEEQELFVMIRHLLQQLLLQRLEDVAVGEAEVQQRKHQLEERSWFRYVHTIVGFYPHVSSYSRLIIVASLKNMQSLVKQLLNDFYRPPCQFADLQEREVRWLLMLIAIATELLFH